VKHFSRSSVLAAIAAIALPFAPVLALEGDEAGVRMSLEEALRIALENNLDLVVARKAPSIAEQGLISEDAAFDGLLTLSGSFQDTTTDSEQVTTTDLGSSSVLFTTDNQPFGGSASYANRLRFGGRYELKLSANQSDPSASRRFISAGIFDVSDFQSDSWRADLSYTMPLLRGFGTEANTYNVLVAKSNVTLSRYELERESEATLKRVEDAYWDLVAARAAVDVARESLRLAQDLLDLNRKKVEVGTLAPIEVTQAEAGVASREEDIIRAETALQNAEDLLLQLLAVPPEDPRWERAVVPTDKPTFEKSAVDVNGALETALANRAEVLSARRSLSDRELGERVARNGAKHGLDLSANVGYGTDSFERLGFTEAGGTISDLVKFEQDDDNLDWAVTLTYAYPIRNRSAKANYAGAVLDRERGEVALQSVELSVRTDVRIAARNVESGAKRVDAARANTVLQRKTLDAEQKKFENGMSTSFEVLRIQTDLSNAQLAEIRAILDYTKALADLERAQGTLLEARGLSLDASSGKE
jgi:outer membrane protein TolC